MRRILALWLLMLFCPSAQALDPSLRITELRHTSWTAKDGLPGRVRYIDQDRNGFLWLATGDGLYRFDGTTFEHITEIGGQSLKGMLLIFLRIQRDGDLWLGFSDGMARVHEGRFEWMGRPLVHEAVYQIIEDDDGDVWCVSGGHLVLLRAGKVLAIDKGWNYPDMSTSAMAIDRQGSIWTTTQDDVHILRRGSKRFADVETNIFAESIQAAANGTVWYAGGGGIELVGDRQGPLDHPLLLTRSAGGAPTVERDGNLWMANGTELWRAQATRDGLEQLSPSARFDRFGVADGLSANTIFSIFEDREGALWVGTSGGLDRFTNQRFVNVALPPNRAMGFGLIPNPDGSVYATPWTHHLYRITSSDIQVVNTPDVITNTLTAYTDPHGTLWTGGRHGVFRFDAGKRFVNVRGEETLADAVRSMTMDRAGALWVGEGSIGHATRLSNGKADSPAGKDGFPEKWNFRAALTGADGQLWFAFEHRVVNVVDGHARTLGPESSGLDVGLISAFCEAGGRLWVGGTKGLAFFDGHRFHTVLDEEGLPLTSITGLVGTRSGEVWANLFAETVRIRAPAVRDVLAHPDARVALQRMTELDGRRGSSVVTNPRPNLVEAADGKIWVSTDSNIGWLDPATLDHDSTSPVVQVTSVTADGHAFPTQGRPELPPLNQHLEVHYTVTELAVPEKIRFRYRLDGVDADWQAVGARRFALYNDLAPGRYRFRVTSTNADGQWNPAVTTLELTVRPAWYQTLVFRAVCVVAMFALAWLAYRAHLSRLARRIGLQLRTQTLERERIARELHDTLLQSFYGLSMQFYAVAEAMPEGGRARSHLATVLERADRALQEGRERVEGLRGLPSGALDVAGIVDEARAEIGDALRRPVRVETSGPESGMHPVVVEQLAAILREALLNAFRHAQATTLHVRVVHSPGSFRLTIADDGVGMGAQTLQDGKPKHWGLLGMRERANRIGARISVTSAPGKGTQVEVRVKGAIAYVRHVGLVRRMLAALNRGKAA